MDFGSAIGKTYNKMLVLRPTFIFPHDLKIINIFINIFNIDIDIFKN